MWYKRANFSRFWTWDSCILDVENRDQALIFFCFVIKKIYLIFDIPSEFCQWKTSSQSEARTFWIQPIANITRSRKFCLSKIARCGYHDQAIRYPTLKYKKKTSQLRHSKISLLPHLSESWWEYGSRQLIGTADPSLTNPPAPGHHFRFYKSN